ncbi:hypothetical protein H5410_022517 [Solanum commersonii]|uniref:DUF4283 domain-containing protein n=1 Tax=Solanum commersonii TaxID=4109 RepID=A0A9J5ZI53_SOLCO|nr:hypothetical protein H5410_022517 [Solanum commersonii]
MMVIDTRRWEQPQENIHPYLTQSNQASRTNTVDKNMLQYAHILKPKNINPTHIMISAKPVVMLHGEPNITWKASEVKALIRQENLQYAIIEKFSYGKPDIIELRRTIPGQCGIKSECTIGVLDTRHILIRLTSLEDYVHPLSTIAFYVKARENF